MFSSQILAAEEFKVGLKVKVTNYGQSYPSYTDMAKAMGLFSEWNNFQAERIAGDTGTIVATSPHLDKLDCGFCVMVKFEGGYQIMDACGIEIDWETMANYHVAKKLVGCARCGETHDHQIVYKKLTHPMDDMTHWAACPTNGQPILMKIVD